MSLARPCVSISHEPPPSHGFLALHPANGRFFVGDAPILQVWAGVCGTLLTFLNGDFNGGWWMWWAASSFGGVRIGLLPWLPRRSSVPCARDSKSHRHARAGACGTTERSGILSKLFTCWPLWSLGYVLLGWRVPLVLPVRQRFVWWRALPSCSMSWLEVDRAIIVWPGAVFGLPPPESLKGQWTLGGAASLLYFGTVWCCLWSAWFW